MLMIHWMISMLDGQACCPGRIRVAAGCEAVGMRCGSPSAFAPSMSLAAEQLPVGIGYSVRAGGGAAGLVRIGIGTEAVERTRRCAGR